MTAVISQLRSDHKEICQVLFQLLPLAQQPCSSDEQRQLVINQLREKLMHLDRLIGGAHHLVEEMMMRQLCDKSLDESHKQLVDNMLADHELLDVFSELLMIRIDEYVADGAKKAVMIRAVNQYVKHYIQHISREQTQLFGLCEQKLQPEDWLILNDVYPVPSSDAQVVPLSQVQ